MKKFRKIKPIDISRLEKKEEEYFDYPLANFARKHKNSSTLFSKTGQLRNFSTPNLPLYFVNCEKKANFRDMDGFLRFEKKIPIKYAVQNRVDIYEAILKKYGSFKEYARDIFKNPFSELSTVKMWNISVVGALVVGMFLMTFIYRYLGEGAAADAKTNGQKTPAGQVLGDSANNGQNPTDIQAVQESVTRLLQDYQQQNQEQINKDDAKKALEKEMADMVEGYPIEKMVPLIAKQDPIVAAFMIGIAKQESGWGEHVPVDKNGDDCNNLWGYRGKNPIGTGGHSCFASAEDAVATVAKRLSFLVSNENVNTPGKMVNIWKCGRDCSLDNPKTAAQWVSTVSTYFGKLNHSERS